MRRALVLAALLLTACHTAPEKPVLRVCADPNNMPFSNRKGEGYENALARLLARDMGAELRYVWWAQRRGNLRETLRAGRCDLVPGVASALESVATSTPYYRASYMVVTRTSDRLTIRSLDDPHLKRLQIGVQLVGDDGSNTPPAHALTRRGIISNVRGFMVQGDYRRAFPQEAILDALAAGQIDIAFVWEPVAAYYAIRHPGMIRLTPVSPAFDGPALPMIYDVSVAVRKDDLPLRQRIDTILQRRHGEIVRRLRSYGLRADEV
ncbi:quinoprotein dehydrogenase-associated putative ABC transporter substrate-binding protein [Sphingobium sp. SCG-1]|uniref:quinoprotein dehydrogenase-associated putative ABC transporter substrate-binding protein n=1 Tax=Sphingobium sp. SCG-1 TaxID=2072936 RepID=UPI000CD6A601|nr:quinoprotein dehydrogenase-associated putative ABC transporter substrate-binding protein [Sphingobium sp. SCG-1]AUW57044.1 quinoprotein dehydrogenase-associated putative ABC transporter substrate-binding protein [Sphingobium sp. SCG-1]